MTLLRKTVEAVWKIGLQRDPEMRGPHSRNSRRRVNASAPNKSFTMIYATSLLLLLAASAGAVSFDGLTHPREFYEEKFVS